MDNLVSSERSEIPFDSVCVCVHSLKPHHTTDNIFIETQDKWH